MAGTHLGLLGSSCGWIFLSLDLAPFWVLSVFVTLSGFAILSGCVPITGCGPRAAPFSVLRHSPALLEQDLGWLGTLSRVPKAQKLSGINLSPHWGQAQLEMQY